ncbi:3-oxoacid CoA-transferase subunit B [Psychrobacter piechaudii]|uniref:3-oxoadipate CoA-transferase subunit B n=1 Tax=Psychrobacter piechaudii TaxID=1945521 RepID=A0A1R4GXN6_9GAMM|nr:3-oxoacid CoA-transferase subunit B [Psychrobacter piechaudii]SJM73000.1 3-oxoadipate CoA-transferase subunit B [Psychrobacter piechaudii]
MSFTARSQEEMAKAIAKDIPEGWYVNLGIGQPTQIANFLPTDKDFFLHSENGLLGMGPAPIEIEEDEDLINAGKQYVTLLRGGSYFHHADSFAMMRGGHIDLCVLGAYQVAENGDLANWSTGKKGAIPAVGGAMDLAVGAKKVYVMMTHQTRKGDPKIVKNLTFPVTGLKCIDRIYTEYATIDVTPDGLKVIDMVEGMTIDDLQAMTEAPIKLG